MTLSAVDATLMLEALKVLELYNITTWPWWFFILYAAVLCLGVEILAYVVLEGFTWAKRIKVKGKHQDVLETIDLMFIYWNRFTMLPFMYHAIQLVVFTPSILIPMEEATLLNVCAPLVMFYLFYDFFYHQFHKALHIRALYPLVHKHHHRQKAPSRGNIDAINVHPFEFITGEYLHLLTIYVVAKYVMDIHMLAVIIFISIGGILASLNHTRYDIDLCWGYLYSVKAHDVHHRLPESNYSQYILFWDWVWGTFRPYEGTAAMKSNGDEPEESSKSK